MPVVIELLQTGVDSHGRILGSDRAHKIVPWFAGDTNRSAELGRHAISPTRPA
jgi:hypothetical protein